MVNQLGAQTLILYKEGIWGELEEMKLESKGILEELRARNHFSTTNFLGIKDMDGREVGLVYGEGRNLQRLLVFIHFHLLWINSVFFPILIQCFPFKFYVDVELVGN